MSSVFLVYRSLRPETCENVRILRIEPETTVLPILPKLPLPPEQRRCTPCHGGADPRSSAVGRKPPAVLRTEGARAGEGVCAGESQVPCTLQPCTRCLRLRELSPVLHKMMRMPINSLGFSLKVPCTLKRIFAQGAMHLEAVTGPFLPVTAHLIAPVLATAGTVPGNGAVVAVSVESSDCDDSTAQSAAAVGRQPPCPRGLSPVSHKMMRMPINSLGFSLKVPCTLRPCMHLKAAP